ncbi:MAG TPA: proton-conducting transporter membrane subunit [Verrucomicrobiae bacterium]|nr:proton-conducting transporter membrane subunit [Verrucomicrobiae bacterium]
MTVLLLILIPAAAGGLAFFVRADRPRRALLVTTAAGHTSLTVSAWVCRPRPTPGGWFALDGLGLLFLSITSVLFLAVSVYTLSYLRRERQGGITDIEEGFLFDNAPEATFTACLLLFLAAMTLVTVSQHVGLLWVAVEATTLASAPLIYFHRHHRSLEATWKYLLICSVGIALALLGNFFLAVAASHPQAGTSGSSPSMLFANLGSQATQLHVPWLKAAFLLILVGYGTKMGLAPLHTWLPDAHSESPSVISALLSGALLNCAFLGIVRTQQVCVAAGLGGFSRQLLVGFGLISMAVAAAFIVGQSDYKRMLAYSSVEHMGILSLGIGLGGAGVFGALLHAINHSLTKAMLFLIAGNILGTFRTKSTVEVRGVLRALPVSGVVWLAGLFAITGSPPFGPFLSEFTILKASLDEGRTIVAVIYLALLAAIFIGMATVALRMAQGEASREPQREPLIAVLPPALLGAGVLLLGIYIPPAIDNLLHETARALGGL